ncbi:hypothetical protein AlmWB_00850 [Candidatus Phytoplasma phoenicium]|uniref:Uncharacterized protein n=1 Tax=Candidatus Phytoplasma phoenicium TaxID=198422 RepID=A0A0L0ML61_9MOLU|nr:hypothetical protein AlmWB_00850 [Candidatus Phytoplasma phoenicium]
MTFFFCQKSNCKRGKKMNHSYIYEINSILQYLSQTQTFEIICGQQKNQI